MHIVAIAWIYVVLMMSITEHSVVAGIATFLLYGVFPISIILYLMRAPKRRQKIKEAENALREQQLAKAGAAEGEVGNKENKIGN
jgi:hypothetical protein